MITVVFVAISSIIALNVPKDLLNDFENSANNTPVMNLNYDENYDALFVSPFLLESKNARNCITVHFADLEATDSGKSHGALDLAMGWRCSFSAI